MVALREKCRVDELFILISVCPRYEPAAGHHKGYRSRIFQKSAGRTRRTARPPALPRALTELLRVTTYEASSISSRAVHNEPIIFQRTATSKAKFVVSLTAANRKRQIEVDHDSLRPSRDRSHYRREAPALSAQDISGWACRIPRGRSNGELHRPQPVLRRRETHRARRRGRQRAYMAPHQRS